MRIVLETKFMEKNVVYNCLFPSCTMIQRQDQPVYRSSVNAPKLSPTFANLLLYLTALPFR